MIIIKIIVINKRKEMVTERGAKLGGGPDD